MKEAAASAEKLNQAQSIEEVEAIINDVTSTIGMNYYLFGVSIPVSLTRGYTAIYNNYPDKWREHYDSNSYAKIDPVVKHCFTSTQPVVWSDLQKIYNSKIEQSFFSLAKQHGLVSGVSVPVHGSKSELGILSFASTKEYNEMSTTQINEVLLTSQILAPIAFSKIVEFEKQMLSSEGDTLTVREKDVLYWAAEGKTSWEISQIIGCSERTVYFHLNNVTKKLNVINRYQAVSKAILLGHIRPSVSS